MEMYRKQGELDACMWFCEKCGNKLYVEKFPLTDEIGEPREQVLGEFAGHQEADLLAVQARGDVDADHAAGFVGDLTLLAGWQIKPNFSLQVGYDFLWVAGIATSEMQLNLDNRDIGDIDAGAQTFYNGVSFGFYGSW